MSTRTLNQLNQNVNTISIIYKSTDKTLNSRERCRTVSAFSQRITQQKACSSTEEISVALDNKPLWTESP